MFSQKLKYNYEFEKKLRVGLVGCGGQAFRNILPSFLYAPVDLHAVCDIDKKKAEQFAGIFGAKAAYTDMREMIEKHKLECVFLEFHHIHPPDSYLPPELRSSIN